jgi:L-seryl-tRNA(Ser) seleniumtransferase
MEDKNQILRNIPQVEKLLQADEISRFTGSIGRAAVADAIRDILAEIRSKAGKGEPVDLENIIPSVVSRCRLKQRDKLQRVINGTGVIIHTNLGRSPISADILKKLASDCSGYCNLEYDLVEQQRGRRGGFAEELLRGMTGAEDALIVNNNASSVFLILSEFARGREVIVSRGELVQIGGGFRLPDIMQQSGAVLVETGTTNITAIEDYRRAVTDNTAMIFSCHRSNFTVQGFTESPALRELAALKDEGIIFARDLGSGNLTADQRLPRNFEPTVRSEIDQGPDLVCFSGDKLLGGCQAGIIVGRKDLVGRLRKNPLMRMLRVDKITYYILQETLIRHVNGENDTISLWRIMHQDKKAIGARINRFLRLITGPAGRKMVQRTATMSTIGGGAMPGYQMESLGVQVDIPGISADDIYASLAGSDVPVIGVIIDGICTIDFSAILDSDVPAVAEAVNRLIGLHEGNR